MKGELTLTVIFWLVGVVLGGSILAHELGNKSLRELVNDPCENSEVAVNGTGSYTCSE